MFTDLEAEFELARRKYRNVTDKCFLSAPDWHGKMFRPKAIPGNPHTGKIPMSFSATLIDFVGGLPELRCWWELMA